jgi:hypothetical protein
LVIQYGVGVGDCHQPLAGTHVQETPAAVIVRLVPAPPPRPAGTTNCLDQILLRTTTVQLAAPLGDRQVIDGTTGMPVTLTTRPAR